MEALPKLKTPTLIVVGSQEIPFFRIVADAVSYALPNAEKAVIEGGGHLINMIRPKEYNERILEFLAGLDRD
jgi:pimeloyl-ACP methyl ester carboxylesterase